MKVSSTTQRDINLKEDFGNVGVSIEAIGTGLFLILNPPANSTIRKEEKFDASSGYAASKYTVTSAAYYRKNERVVIFSSANVRKGIAQIIAIDTDAEKVTIKKIGTDFTPASGDKILTAMDFYIKKGNFITIQSCEDVQAVSLLAEEESETDNCSIESEALKKKI